MIKLNWMRLEGQVTRVGEKRNEYRVLVGKSERKKQFGISRVGLENSIKLDVKNNGTG
jgi:hypothetical protein